MSTIREVHPTQKPPHALRAAHKSYQRASEEALAKDSNILDLGKVQINDGDPRLSLVTELKKSDLVKVFASFESPPRSDGYQGFDDVKVYEHRDFSGKLMGF